MTYFDRFDICEAYLVFEWNWHDGGIDGYRPSNRRRNMSTDYQLSRMRFKASPMLSYEHLTDNGKDIYAGLLARYGLTEEGL